MLEYEKNAVIESVSLSINDYGVLSSWIVVDYGGGSKQDFGGYILYLPNSYPHQDIKSLAGHFILRVMEVVGVTEWEKLKGKTIRVRCNNTEIEEIGHIIKDDWFCPSLANMHRPFCKEFTNV